MTHQNHQTNGASLEDCHTNFFALVGIRWLSRWKLSISWAMYSLFTRYERAPHSILARCGCVWVYFYQMCVRSDCARVWGRPWFLKRVNLHQSSEGKREQIRLRHSLLSFVRGYIQFYLAWAVIRFRRYYIRVTTALRSELGYQFKCFLPANVIFCFDKRRGKKCSRWAYWLGNLLRFCKIRELVRYQKWSQSNVSNLFKI